MKKLFIAFVLMLAAFNGYSQLGIGFGGRGFGMGMRIPLGGNNGPNRSRNIENQVQRMKSDLNLSDDQVIKVRSLLVERDRRRNGDNPMLSAEFNQRLEKILTPEQMNTLKQNRQQKRQQKQQQTPPPNKDGKQPEPMEDNDDVYN